MPFRRSAVVAAILLFVGLVPIALMLRTMVQLWTPAPVWDEWDTPGAVLVQLCQGRLEPAAFWAQHNESRKLFPRLLYVALAQLGGWDVRKEMALTFVAVLLTTAVLFHLVRRMPGANVRLALGAWAVAAFLCFSPAQVENFLWGVQVEVFFPGLAVLLMAAVNLSARTLPWKAVLNGALALIATYTVAHGMLLWLLGVPLLRPGERLRRGALLIYFTYAICAAVAIGFYFRGYHRPAAHPEFLQAATAQALVDYVILWAGSLFAPALVSPFAVGRAALLLLVVCLVVAALMARQTGSWRRFYAPLLITGYAALTAAVTAAGRIGFGVQQALDPRYRVSSLMLYLAIVAFAAAIYTALPTAARARRALVGAACLLLAVLVVAGWRGAIRDVAVNERSLHLRNFGLLRSLLWYEVVPQNPDLARFHPLPDVLRERIRVLRDCGVLRLPFVAPEITMHLQPSSADNAARGRLAHCALENERELRVSGFAGLPDGGQPDCVVIAYAENGGWRPIALVEMAWKPPPNERGSFSRTLPVAILPVGNVTIAAWSADEKAGRLYPLEGTAVLDVPPPQP